MITGAFATLYPRADFPHLIYVLPELFIGAVYAWHSIRGSLRRRGRTRTLLAVWLFGGLILVFGVPLKEILSHDLKKSTFPHFRGVFVESEEKDVVSDRLQKIEKAIPKDEPLFFLTPYAGFYYLLTERKNPTPFDFPIIPELGMQGQNEVVSAIQRRQIPYVCLEHESWRLTPAQLEEFVQNTMKHGQDLGACVLFSY
jgi:hypothetical protein